MQDDYLETDVLFQKVLWIQFIVWKYVKDFWLELVLVVMLCFVWSHSTAAVVVFLLAGVSTVWVIAFTIAMDVTFHISWRHCVGCHNTLAS